MPRYVRTSATGAHGAVELLQYVQQHHKLPTNRCWCPRHVTSATPITNRQPPASSLQPTRPSVASSPTLPCRPTKLLRAPPPPRSHRPTRRGFHLQRVALLEGLDTAYAYGRIFPCRASVAAAPPPTNDAPPASAAEHRRLASRAQPTHAHLHPVLNPWGPAVAPSASRRHVRRNRR